MNQADGPIDANKVLAVVQAVAREARPHLDARVELVLRLEREFATSLPEQALASSETPRDLLRYLLSSAGQGPRAADTSVASLAHVTDVPPPYQAQTLTEALEYHVERQPDRLTVHLYEEGRETPITYRQLYDGARGYAARLARLGLQPGQMVAIMLPTCKEY